MTGKWLWITFAAILTAIIVTCILGTVKVKGDAMAPAISDGDVVFINKMAYFYQKPERGDVVAFHCDVYSEDEEGSILLRRVAASEGDRVRITDGRLYVNGVVYEGYSEHNVYLEPMDETRIGRGRVFVLSDSQTAVLDSRDQAVGQLRTDELDGKVCFK